MEEKEVVNYCSFRYICKYLESFNEKLYLIKELGNVSSVNVQCKYFSPEIRK